MHSPFAPHTFEVSISFLYPHFDMDDIVVLQALITKINNLINKKNNF